MDQGVLHSLQRACNDKGLLIKLIVHALAVHRASLVSQVFSFSDAVPSWRLSGHMDKLRIPLKLGFTPGDGSLGSPAFVQETEGLSPGQQQWGNSRELAEHWSTEAASTTANISCCSWKKKLWKSDMICSWEEKSSLVWRCTVSESQNPLHPSPLGANSRMLFQTTSLSVLPGRCSPGSATSPLPEPPAWLCRHPKTTGTCIALFTKGCMVHKGLSSHFWTHSLQLMWGFETLSDLSDFVTCLGFCTGFFFRLFLLNLGPG